VSRFVPSPALLVSVVALVLSLGGVGYAATQIGTRQIANDAITSPKIRNGAVQPADLGPATVKSLQVRAYASVVVSPDVALDATRTRGFATVTRPATGIYCLTLSDDRVDASATAPVLTVDWDNSSGSNLTAYFSKSAQGCPEGTDLAVRTYSFTAGKPYRLANTVAFTLLVP
jgi:hypothetical protein